MATATATATKSTGRWSGIRHAVKVNTSLRVDPDVFLHARKAADLEAVSLNLYFEQAIRARNATHGLVGEADEAGE
jgi:hypothetical protein